MTPSEIKRTIGGGIAAALIMLATNDGWLQFVIRGFQ